jgi:hypothetical protein
MLKLDKLTPLQEQQLIEFRQECLNIGLSTNRIDRTKNQESINYIYKKYLNINKEPYIWYVDSPLMYNLIINILYNISDDKNFKGNLRSNLRDNLSNNLSDNLWNDLRNNLRDNLESNLIDNLRSNLWNNLSSNLSSNLKDNLSNNLSDNLIDNLRNNLSDNLESNLIDNLKDNLSDNLSDNLESNFESNLESNLWNDLRNNLSNNLSNNLWNDLRNNLSDNLWNNLRDNLWNNLRDNKLFYNICYSNLDIYWLSFYMFSFKFLNINYGNILNNDLNLFFELQKNIGYIFYHSDICFISEKSIEINKKGIQLHADKKPAILFADGYCLWYLNGVEVPKEIVLSDKDDIDVNSIFTEKNVEVRREILRKIGIDNVIKKTNCKILDKSDNKIYELLEIDLKLQNPAHYLKMINPSIGTYHLEGVPFECDTIEKSLAWRDSEWERGQKFKGYIKPEVLT